MHYRTVYYAGRPVLHILHIARGRWTKDEKDSYGRRFGPVLAV